MLQQEEKKNSIQEISLNDKTYPAMLREIPHPPEKLWIWGKFPTAKNWLAVVGTRRCTAYGKEIAKKLISEIAPHNFCIVSGLAFGIDTAAHQAALESNIPTVAVLGSGINPEALHPSKNLRLAEDIVS